MPDTKTAELLENARKTAKRGLNPVLAVDPVTGKKDKICFVSDRRMDVIAKRGMGHAKDLAYSEPEVLIGPKAIFRGVREEGELQWLCYVGIPKHSYAKNGDTKPPRKGEVYLAFVNEEGVVYNGRWECCDQDDVTLPENHLTRFEERVI
jgi:hypothetical protein